MGFLSINNLHRDAHVMSTGKEVYEQEKIEGSSTHIKISSINDQELDLKTYHGGLPSAQHFLDVVNAFLETERTWDMLLFMDSLGYGEAKSFTIYGEGYGGKTLQMGATYGPDTRFVAFDVLVNYKSGKELWLNVPQAYNVATAMGCDFVPWSKIPSTWEAVDKARDQKSRQGLKVFPETDGKCEGIVIKPLQEQIDCHGSRVLAKHKQSWARENKANPVRGKEYDIKLATTKALAQEWATVGRLAHVLDHLRARGAACSTPADTRAVIDEMEADIKKEAGLDILPLLTQDVFKAVRNVTAGMFVAYTKNPDGFCFDMPTNPE